VENRPVARGSALVILLVVLASLGGLTLILLPRLSSLQSETEDALICGRLENAARSALERATQWVRATRPAGPSGSFEVFHIGSGDGPERLELPVPDKLARTFFEDIEVTTAVQWCLFTVENIPIGRARLFPPSLASDAEEVVFCQSYDSVGHGVPCQIRGEKGAWRLVVTARLKDDGEALPARQVSFERVMVLER
jgi:hypothetical protein